MKRLILVLVAFTAFTVIAQEKKPVEPAKPAPATAEKVFTLEELAKFDGKEGRPAYVAINGIVYDVTGVKAWAKGEHGNGKPGTDITPLITTKSPHGDKVTKNLKAVGKLKK